MDTNNNIGGEEEEEGSSSSRNDNSSTKRNANVDDAKIEAVNDVSGKNHIQETFLSTMTFSASSNSLSRRRLRGNCECDECGFSISSDILQAIQRRRLMDGMKSNVIETTRMPSLPRTQNRILIRRMESVSVWKLTMPWNAEPMIEFGNSHRLVFVARLLEGSEITSIGKGIIGSSDESRNRAKTEWKQNKAYFFLSNGGQAVGWIHTSTTVSERPKGHAIIYTFKIPLPDEMIHNLSTEDDTLSRPKWMTDIFQIFSDCLSEVCEIKKKFDALPNTLAAAESLSSIDISEKHSETIAAIVSELDHEQ